VSPTGNDPSLVLSPHWPTSATRLRPDRRKCAEATRHRTRTETVPKHRLEGLPFGAYGSACRHDFFTFEVLIWRALATYYVLFFLHPETRRVILAGFTRHPTEAWVTQITRNAVDDTSAALDPCRYVLHDRNAKLCSAFDDVLASEGLHCLRLAPTQPRSERIRGTVGAIGQAGMPLQAFPLWRTLTWRMLTPASLDRLRRALSFRARHQGKRNALLFPAPVTHNASAKRPLSQTSRRSTSILPSRRLIIFTSRASDGSPTGRTTATLSGKS
jgi:hypothetical protein